MPRDIKEICRRVSLAGLIGHWVPLRRQGKEHVGLCPFHQERTPSFHVFEDNPHYHCFGCQANGDALDFLQKYHGWDFALALEYLEEQGGVRHEPSAAPPAPLPAPARQETSPDEERQKKIEAAAGIWRDGHPAACTPVETYLRGRGIDPDLLPDGLPVRLRYHRGLWHTEANKKLWCMVGAIQDAHSQFCGVHRTYLQAADAHAHPDTAAALRASGMTPAHGEVVIKASVERAKKMLGTARGGSVRLAPAAETMAIAEGIETALSVMQATGLAAWAALSLGNLGGLALPPEVHKVMLCTDNDARDPARAEALVEEAAAAYRRQGVTVHIMRPPVGKDFNDVLMEPFRALEHPPP